MKEIQIPFEVLVGLQVADRTCIRKHSKMWRRYARRGFCFKGGAADRWAHFKNIA